VLIYLKQEKVLTSKDLNEHLSWVLPFKPVVVPHEKKSLKPLVRQLVPLWRQYQTSQAKKSLYRCTGWSSCIFLQRNFLYCGKLFKNLHPCFGCSQVGNYFSFHCAEGIINSLLKTEKVLHIIGAWVWCCRRHRHLGCLLNRARSRDELVTLCYQHSFDHFFFPLVSQPSQFEHRKYDSCQYCIIAFQEGCESCFDCLQKKQPQWQILEEMKDFLYVHYMKSIHHYVIF